MSIRFRFSALLVHLALCALSVRATADPPAPAKAWIGLHVESGGKSGLDKIAQSIPALGKLGVNALVLEIDYNFDFDSRPEMKNPGGVTRAQAKQFAALCRASG